LRYLFLCIFVILVFGTSALADDVITLELETPGINNPEPKEEAAQTVEKTVTTVKGQKSEKPRKVGRIAVVTVDNVPIYSLQNTKSKVYSNCRKDMSLAIVSTSGSWYGVLMVDGSIGWIQASKVKLLDYTTVLPEIQRGTLPSRGGSYTRGQDNPIVQTALQYLGVPYVYGGTSSTNGIDCSAFVRMVYAQFGVKLPRVSRDQANVGIPVSPDDIQPGDRLYFACKHSYVDHCGIYIGDGYFIHASASRGGVAVDDLNSKFYSSTLVAIMR